MAASTAAPAITDQQSSENIHSSSELAAVRASEESSGGQESLAPTHVLGHSFLHLHLHTRAGVIVPRLADGQSGG